MYYKQKEAQSLVGRKVTCNHRPGRTGTALSIYDPRNWANTFAFGFENDSPDAEEVKTHVNRCLDRGVDMYYMVPVLWDFGVTNERIGTLQLQGTILSL